MRNINEYILEKLVIDSDTGNIDEAINAFKTVTGLNDDTALKETRQWLIKYSIKKFTTIYATGDDVETCKVPSNGKDLIHIMSIEMFDKANEELDNTEKDRLHRVWNDIDGGATIRGWDNGLTFKNWHTMKRPFIFICKR